MAGVFDFCNKSRVVVEGAPDDPSAMDMNGWLFTPRPSTPYRPTFKVTLYGLRWYLSGNSLDLNTNPQYNAGRLRDFYIRNRMWGTFILDHEYLGPIQCKFAKAVSIPEALPNSNGLIDKFEINLIHNNPVWPN